jgi:hypothetical protein
MQQPALIEVEFVEEADRESFGRAGIAAVKIVCIKGEPGGYLAGLAAGDVVFIGRGREWILKKSPEGKFFLFPAGLTGPAGFTGPAGRVGVAGIMRKMCGDQR